MPDERTRMSLSWHTIIGFCMCKLQICFHRGFQIEATSKFLIQCLLFKLSKATDTSSHVNGFAEVCSTVINELFICHIPLVVVLRHLRQCFNIGPELFGQLSTSLHHCMVYIAHSAAPSESEVFCMSVDEPKFCTLSEWKASSEVINEGSSTELCLELALKIISCGNFINFHFHGISTLFGQDHICSTWLGVHVELIHWTNLPTRISNISSERCEVTPAKR